MALVAKERYMKWFEDPDSWVYRGFAYWFKNPLWDKPIPKGASLCPYFQRALISVLIFRPIVSLVIVPLLIITRWMLKGTGRVLSPLDKWITRNVFKQDPDLHGPGLGLVFSILGLGGVGVIIYVIIEGIKAYLINILPYPEYHIPVSCTALLLITMIVTSVYRFGVRNIGKKTCPVQWYTYLVAAGTLLAVITGIPGGLSRGLHNIWAGIAYVVVGGGAVVYGILVFVGGIIWWLLTLPVAGVAWPLWVIGLAIIVAACEFVVRRVIKIKPTIRPAVAFDTRAAWYNIMAHVFDGNHGHKVNKIICRHIDEQPNMSSGGSCLPSYKMGAILALVMDSITIPDVCSTFSTSEIKALERECIRRKYVRDGMLYVLEVLIDEVCDEEDKRNETTKDAVYERLNKLADALYGLPTSDAAEKPHQIIIQYTDSVIIPTQRARIARDRELARLIEARRDRRNGICLRLTGALKIVFIPITWPFVRLWDGIITFVEYAWVVAKAKKRDACPYVMFNHPSED